ncbi:hypothetical protein BHE74_00053256 [Ensete ventricosum]|nr:hypothetical protein BHE74_00053256 [Ensete ventricosum]
MTDYGFDAHKKAACGQRHHPQGLLPARATTSRGSACKGGTRGGAGYRGGCPLVGRLPAGKGSHRLRRGSGGGGGAEGERGVRASFGEKDDPAPMNSENFEDCPRVYNSHNTLNNSRNSIDYPLI